MKKKIKKYPNIYLALAICLVAVGIGATIGFVGSPETESEEDFSRVTVQWSIEETTQPLTHEVNIGVSGIEDERVYSTTEKVEGNKPFSGNFALPMGTDITKDFSNGEMVESKTMGDWRVHNGVDFGGSAGNDVVAVSNGTVKKVYDDSFWGTVVEIDHGNGMTVRYCGLKSGSCLPEGSEVEKYDKIGSLGHIPVEISDSDHLHLEILIDGEYVDPLKALNKVGDNSAE
ncbi:MAG: M23 family metallopeptidase [Ruminococcaceae bacterium]|nr:M23 family metallopeptidase [Oscillospiraceae bacterium]